jgi:hypothetical protein
MLVSWGPGSHVGTVILFGKTFDSWIWWYRFSTTSSWEQDFMHATSEILWHKDVLRTLFLGNSRDKAKIISQGRWLHSFKLPGM